MVPEVKVATRDAAHERAHFPRSDRPDDLQIAGLAPMSSVDWPGAFVATVFAQGCPWACPYCHNHAIIDPRIPGVIAWQSVEDLLKRRHGLLDGVVFSGGEATRQLALLPAVRRVRELGFQVGLHTAGPYPARLRMLLESGCVDWVGMDVKALPGANYERVVGRAGAGHKAWESLDILLESEVAYEVRLTVFPDGAGDEWEVVRALKERGVRSFALQQARTQGAPADFRGGGRAWDERVSELVERVRDVGFEEFVFRPA